MDFLADIQKHAATVDEAVVEQMAKTYRLVLSRPDSALVSFSDPAELAVVRENFVKKKLGVTEGDDSIDQAIKAVGAKIPGRKNRLTVYYLLAEHYNKLGVFQA